MNRRIYLRQAISDYFDLPYENQGVKTKLRIDNLDYDNIMDKYTTLCKSM